ncbi:lytic polysaccharide monooxygenase [Xylaria acuta]|nr:lytic polysaccharide monooxygenase [Xylaria acuta]
MKVFYPLVTLSTTALSPVSAHWVYNRLIVNGEFIGKPYQYTRPPQNGNNFLSEVNSTDMRCNVGGGSGAPNNTETATVRAGDELGFSIGSTFGHPGDPASLPLAGAAGSTTTERLLLFLVVIIRRTARGRWARTASPRRARVRRRLGHAQADDVPVHAAGRDALAGEYLLRAEGMAVHAAHKRGGAQFYVSCAQIRVVNDLRAGNRNSSELGPLVKIPGVSYRGDEPGVLLPVFWSGLTRYTTAGPALWPPGNERAACCEAPVRRLFRNYGLEDARAAY